MHIRNLFWRRKTEKTEKTEAAAEERVLSMFPPGHFYSPVVDPELLLAGGKDHWKGSSGCAGINFNDESQKFILENAIGKHVGAYDYPEHSDENGENPRFHHGNDQFGWLDSRLLFGMLNLYKPKNYIEVGGGYSSLLVAEVNARFLGSSINFVSIEPYPRPFLERGLKGLSRLIKQKVEDVPLGVFDVLGENDVLFIDSSHVSKTGSDVNHLVFEILPRLKKGVLIHIHDIFLPAEYLREWVIDQNRSWNEQYLIRALLMYSTAFEVVFASYYVFLQYPELVKQALNLPAEGPALPGCSLWIRKI